MLGGLWIIAGCAPPDDLEEVDASTQAAPQEREASTTNPDSLEHIVYRGVPRVAARYGSTLILEGDIVVGPKDLEPIDDFAEGETLIRKGVRTSGARGAATYQWLNGVVPYTFDPNVSGAVPVGGGPSQRDLFLAAVTDVTNSAPGLTFVPRTTQADYVTFRIDSSTDICGSSPVGRQGGQQFVNVVASCLAGYSTHHEIMHTLGLFHEQSRTDLTSNITISWNNIQGCTDAATSRAQCGTAACSPNPLSCGCTAANVATCDFSHNFGVKSTSGDLGTYDFDSIMHYGAFSFSKCRTSAGTTVLCSDAGAILQQTLVPPAGTSIGQRSRLSGGDSFSLAAMYPRAAIQQSVFGNSGRARVCQLSGREQDANTWFVMSITPVAGYADDGSIDTALPEGDYNVECSARSAFWMNRYAYPAAATTRTVRLQDYSASQLEVYGSGASRFRVLNPGLIAVLF